MWFCLFLERTVLRSKLFQKEKDFIFLSTFVFSFIYFIHSWFQDSKKVSCGKLIEKNTCG